MLSGKVLILALSLAYLAGLVHCHACKCNEETCMEGDDTFAGRYLNCTRTTKTKTKCGTDETKEREDCELECCKITMMGAKALAEIMTKPNFLHPEKMNEEDKLCVDACVKSLMVCKNDVLSREGK